MKIDKNPADANFAIGPNTRYLPFAVEGFEPLVELALDLRWSWNHAADELWQRLDAKLWNLTRNPWLILQTVSRDYLRSFLADATVQEKIQTLIAARHSVLAAPTWFGENYPEPPIGCVAYFSMEFMLSEALPIYSGGLGNVAGDQLKAASDLGVPVAGIGLLYQRGYFRQVIDWDGGQRALYPYNDPGQLPIMPLRESNGEWLRLELKFPGYSIWLRTWEVQVGRVRLYLLDSNDPANVPAHRGVTSELYGGGPELRLQQELILGIGGWRLLRAIGLDPEVCHLNEGHAAFAVLERARDFKRASDCSFDVALAATRAGNLFTTHTPVEAGFDRFSPELVQRYLSDYAEHELEISADALLALGRHNPSDGAEPFNMAYLAFRGSGAVNGVSRLHGEVSRGIFQPLFPRWPRAEVPVRHITNGVHMPSWDSAEADALWTDCCGKERWLGTTADLGTGIGSASDSRLWQLRAANRKSLVGYVREQLAKQLEAVGAEAEQRQVVQNLFEAETLTLGFARRFATYKRPNLLLHDPDRLLRLLTDTQRPVQLVIAGKAHPADHAGQLMIQEWACFIRGTEARRHVAFLSDYDMLMAEHLVQGVDLWLNTPRRPWEASGTSGMKVLVNGGLNLSELDGWWAEAYTPAVGWALGDGREHGDDAEWDSAEAMELYRLLEDEVIPAFYQRDATGIPAQWLARMRASMASLTPCFSANRTVLEYTQQHYVPAAVAYRIRAGDNGAIGMDMVNWEQTLKQKWPTLHFGEMKVETRAAQHRFEAQVYLDDLDPQWVQVELYAQAVDGSAPVRQEMTRGGPVAEGSGSYFYRTQVAASRPAMDFTARVIPRYSGIAVPLEAGLILWQR